MSPDASHPSSDTPPSPASVAEHSIAWQPLTPAGVAAFATARGSRLFLLQLITAGLTAWVVLWFLGANWFPIIREAIGRLPDQGLIQNQQLSLAGATAEPLAENRFLAVVVDADGIGTPSLATDLRVEFHRRNAAVCSLFGCLNFDYPPDSTLQFNRPELDSRWGAWQPMFYWIAGLGTAVWLLISWAVLATIYCPLVRLYAFFKDRHLTLVGSWKLCCAALLPAALAASGCILLYGLGLIDLPQFLIFWSLHLAVGWVYLILSPLKLPRASDARPLTKNPFGDGPAAQAPLPENSPGASDGNPS